MEDNFRRYEKAGFYKVMEAYINEQDNPLQWFYLSFAGEEGFRGAAIVEARGIVTAITRCSLLKINPRGDVLGIPIGQNISSVPLEARDRLLSKTELETIFTDL